MSLYQVPKKEISEVKDNKLGGIIVALIFLIVTSVIFAFIANQTNLFADDAFLTVIFQVLLGIAIIFIICIVSNIFALKRMHTHAFALLAFSYAFIVILISGGLILLGAFGFLYNTPTLSLIGFGGGLLVIVLAIVLWKLFLRKHLVKAAKWLSIAANVVVNEPGMLVVSFIQGLIISIAGATSTTLIYSIVELYGPDYQGADLGIILGLIQFFYLWLTFFLIYYFDAVNIFVAYSRIKGVDPTIGQGISAASSRVLSIGVFALISTLVYFITNILRNLASEGYQSSSNNNNPAGAIFSVVLSFLLSFVEYIYYLISFFTLPIITIRKKGAVESMKESYKMFTKNTWDIILSDMSFSWGVFALYTLSGAIAGGFGFLYGAVLFTAAYDANDALLGGLFIGIVSIFVGIIITKLFVRPLYNAFVTAFYVYASEGPDALVIASTELVDQVETSLAKAKVKQDKKNRSRA